MPNKEIKLKPLPEVGKEYHFWDDGKTSPSRHYICRVERILTPKEAMKFVIDVPMQDPNTLNTWTEQFSLYDHWKEEAPQHPWLFAENTDAFIEISCPSYDDHNLWCVRIKDGGWFSLDIQSWWQGGRLDVDGEIYKEVVDYWEGEGEYDKVEAYKKEKYGPY